jgi:SAM-dependent methyltransferase
MPVESYGQAFYEEQSGGSLQSARIILGEVLPILQPRRVLDVGCGVGTWLRAALDLGVQEVLGIDGDYVDQAALQIAPDWFIAADLARISIHDALTIEGASRFDLIICMEVAEHLPFARARALVEELTGLADAVVFSAAVPFQFGEHHVNEQWPEFWALLFHERGFACFDCIRDRVWSNPEVDWWYAQNTFIFAREGSVAAGQLSDRTETAGLARVHPKNFLVNLLSLPRRYRQQASGEEIADFQTLQTAYAQRAPVPPLAAVLRANAAPPGARDVFPWTRTEVYEPEREIAEGGQYLRDAEQAYIELREHNAAIEKSRLYLTQRLAESHDVAAAQFLRADRLKAKADRLEADRQYWESQSLEFAHQLSLMAAAAQDKPSSPEERVARLLLRAASRIPRPVRRAAWQSLRMLRGKRQPPQPVLVPAQSVPAEIVAPAEADLEVAIPNDAPLRRWGENHGAVGHATLEKAVARLRRFGLFDAPNYLARNEDVAKAGFDPYRHFLQAGALEDRGRTDSEELARVMGSLTLMGSVARSAPQSPDDFSALPGLVDRIPHIGIYVSSFGNLFMEEIASDLAHDLRSVGLQVDVLDETSSIDNRPPVILFVAPHEFFTLGAGPSWVREDVLSRAFMFGTEQVQTKWFNLALPFVLMSRGVLDICAQTAMIFAQAGMPALHVLPGCRLRPSGLTEQDRTHPLFRILPAAAKLEPEPKREFAARPLDFNFFGNGSPRRNRFFSRNAAFFSEYEAFLYCRNAERGPLLGRGQENALTRLAAHVSGHSKITLNIHRDDLGFFEWHRMVRLGMCAGSVVVSDPCLPHPDFIAGQHYFQEQARHIPDLLEWLLKTPEGGREAEKIRSNVDDLITNAFDTRRTMTQLLGFLAQQAGIA